MGSESHLAMGGSQIGTGSGRGEPAMTTAMFLPGRHPSLRRRATERMASYSSRMARYMRSQPSAWRSFGPVPGVRETSAITPAPG